MVGGCISSFGVEKLVFIDTIIKTNVYLNILKNNLIQRAEEMGISNSFKFYQDNDPKYTTRIMQESCCADALNSSSPATNPGPEHYRQIIGRIK